MHLFFDIHHRGEVFLDDEGEQFSSLGAACDHLAQVLCEFVHSGGEFENIRDMVVNVTDRGKLPGRADHRHHAGTARARCIAD